MQPTEVNHRRFCQKVQSYCISWANFGCLLAQSKPGEVKGRCVRTAVSVGKAGGRSSEPTAGIGLWRGAKRGLPNKRCWMLGQSWNAASVSMQPPLINTHIKHLKHPIVSKPQRRSEQLMTYCMVNRQTFSLLIKTNSPLAIKSSRFFFQETNTHSFGLLDGWPKSSIIWIFSETPVLFCYLQACLEFNQEVHIKIIKGICQLHYAMTPQCSVKAQLG